MGLNKMPVVPDIETYTAQNLSSRAQFFGCNDTAAATIIFIPNTYETAYSGSTYFFTLAGIETVFDGGLAMARQANDTNWPTCVACGILHKNTPSLPESCKACLDKYCWTG
jgi:lysophospholipase